MSKKTQTPPRARTPEAQEPDDADTLPPLNLAALEDPETLAHSLVHLMDCLRIPRRSMDDARRFLMVERDLLWDTVNGWSAPRLVAELRKELRKREPASASAAREPTVAESARHPSDPRIIADTIRMLIEKDATYRRVEVQHELAKMWHLIPDALRRRVMGEGFPRSKATWAALADALAATLAETADDPHAPYMPPAWFREEFGVKSERLRTLHRRHPDRMYVRIVHGRKWYSVPDAITAWPQDVGYCPEPAKT